MALSKISMSYFLESVDLTLFGKKKKKKMFVDITELNILRWGDYPGLFGWTLSIITYILTRGKQRETAPQKRR